MYNENQEIAIKEDDIKVTSKCSWCCYKTSSLKINLFCERGLFPLHNCSLMFM